MSETQRFDTHVVQEQDYRFRIRFDEEGIPDLLTDETPPVGSGTGPNPSRLLAAAVGNCLAASLLFCMRKARLDVEELEAEVSTTLGRNEEGRWRIQGLEVRVLPTVSGEAEAKMGRCVDLFESFCVVTESVRRGIDVDVTVAPRVTASAA